MIENKNIFIQKEEFLYNLQEFSNSVLENILKSKVVLDTELNVLENENFHHIMRFLKGNTKQEKVFVKWLIGTAIKAEKLSANSGFYTVIFSLIIFNTMLKTNFLEKSKISSQEELTNFFKNNMELWKETFIENNIEIFKQEYIEIFADKILKDEVLKNAVMSAIDMAGLQGFISFEDSENDSYFIEVRTGYSFPCSNSKAFLNKNLCWDFKDVKVLVIDGILEKISEIDKILRKNNETKEPMLLCAQGFEEEVLATLKVNFDKKRLNIIPVKFASDLETLNILNDISICCGGNIVSTLKGDMLLYVDYDSLPVVERVVCTENTLLIRNNKTLNAVAAQIKTLSEKKDRKQNELYDVSVFYEKRIKNLISNNVIVKLPQMTKTESIYEKTKADVFLRTIKTSLEYGCVKLEKDLFLKENNNIDYFWNKAFQECINALFDLNKNINSSNNEHLHIIPSMTLYLSLYFAGLNMLQFVGSSGVVV